MDSIYDELISENPFFVELKSEFNNLYQHCIKESWVICVPRIGSLVERVFSVEEFCAHILVPNEELPETHYTTLTDKLVTVLNKVIAVEINNSLVVQSHILFEETFYTEDFIKYKVWCVETPLEPASIKHGHVTSLEQLMTVNDCIELLWTQSAGHQVLEQIDQCVKSFIQKNDKMPTSIGFLSDAVGALYTQCSQIAFQNKRLKDKSKYCKQTMEAIKLSVETYMQDLIYGHIFKSICTCAAYEDARLNKIIRNLADIQLRDLDIRKDLYDTIPKARHILSKLNNCTSILEKVICLKNTLNVINRRDMGEDKAIFLTADDLLPVFLFLIIKSGMPNWKSQLTYMKEFRFSAKAKGTADETAFLITTLEAVIEHILSGELIGSPNPESYYYESDFKNETNFKKHKNSVTESNSTLNITEQNTLENLFEYIKLSKYEKVKEILERNQKLTDETSNDFHLSLDINEELDELFNDDDDDSPPELCHPLCNCRKCCRTISKKLLRTSPTVSSRDSHGLTALHIACIHGTAYIVELLISMKADIEATDLNECTALHYASLRGHQNSLLLLLHSGANINKVNLDKNTPLHLAANNGHLNCVKALIYFSEHNRCELHINYANENGDTPLHLAAKWGYESIAKILIENGGEPSLQNKKNKTSFDYAHNLKILNVLKSCSPSLYEFIHITRTNDGENIKKNRVSRENINIQEKRDSVSSIENMKRIERVLRAISFGDVKLACFFMNIDYSVKKVAVGITNQDSVSSCHPLCECKPCQSKSPITEVQNDFDVNFCDSNGNTALHFASRYDLEELCEILIRNNANINCVNKNGQTPLHLAALHNKMGSLQSLLENGADINAINISKDTPLHEASGMGNIGAVKILLKYNADVTLRNGLDKTPLDIAKDKVYLTIIDLLDKSLETSMGT